jgi:hypothetical protein
MHVFALFGFEILRGCALNIWGETLVIVDFGRFAIFET